MPPPYIPLHPIHWSASADRGNFEMGVEKADGDVDACHPACSRGVEKAQPEVVKKRAVSMPLRSGMSQAQSSKITQPTPLPCIRSVPREPSTTRLYSESCGVPGESHVTIALSIRPLSNTALCHPDSRSRHPPVPTLQAGNAHVGPRQQPISTGPRQSPTVLQTLLSGRVVVETGLRGWLRSGCARALAGQCC